MPNSPLLLGRVRLGYSGIRIYSGYFSPGGRIAGMEIQVFRNENSSQTNAYSRYSNYSYSGLIPNGHALKLFMLWRHLLARVKVNYRSIYSRILTRECVVAMAMELVKNKA